MLLPIVALLFIGWVYCTFFVDFGGQTLASHAQEVWQSKLVQTKLDVIGAAFSQKCQTAYARFKVLTGLSKTPPPASEATPHAQSVRKGTPYPQLQHEFSPKDRKELDSLIVGGRQ